MMTAFGYNQLRANPNQRHDVFISLCKIKPSSLFNVEASYLPATNNWPRVHFISFTPVFICNKVSSTTGSVKKIKSIYSSFVVLKQLIPTFVMYNSGGCREGRTTSTLETGQYYKQMRDKHIYCTKP